MKSKKKLPLLFGTLAAGVVCLTMGIGAVFGGDDATPITPNNLVVVDKDENNHTSAEFTYGQWSQLQAGGLEIVEGYDFVAPTSSSDPWAGIYQEIANDAVFCNFEVRTVTVNCYVDNNKISESDIFVAKNATISIDSSNVIQIGPNKLRVTTNNGYNFAGLFNSSGTQITSSSQAISVTTDTTVSVKWTTKTYTISYVLNGGTRTGGVSSYTYSPNSQTVSIGSASKSGGYLLSSITASAGTIDGSILTIPANTTGTITVTWKWVPPLPTKPTNAYAIGRYNSASTNAYPTLVDNNTKVSYPAFDGYCWVTFGSDTGLTESSVRWIIIGGYETTYAPDNYLTTAFGSNNEDKTQLSTGRILLISEKILDRNGSIWESYFNCDDYLYSPSNQYGKTNYSGESSSRHKGLMYAMSQVKTVTGLTLSTGTSAGRIVTMNLTTYWYEDSSNQGNDDTSVKGQLFFPLATKDTSYVNSSYAADQSFCIENYLGTSGDSRWKAYYGTNTIASTWWLRSGGCGLYLYVCCIFSSGVLNNGYSLSNAYGVRPAFVLKI